MTSHCFWRFLMRFSVMSAALLLLWAVFFYETITDRISRFRFESNHIYTFVRTGEEFEDSVRENKNNHNKRIVNPNTKFYEHLGSQGLYSLAQMIEFHESDNIKEEETRKERLTERQALVCYDSDVAPVTEQRVNQLKKYIAVGMNNPWACGGLGNEVIVSLYVERVTQMALLHAMEEKARKKYFSSE